jgi:nucleoside-diphosphate-sugar epimerase
MIVVTGATGLLGSHLLFHLSSDQDEIVGLYRDASRIDRVKRLFTHYDPENGTKRFDKITWKECDILDVVTLEEMINENDLVYHCAALVSFHRKDFRQLIRINRRGTENVVNVCLAKKAAKLCHVSSTAALGYDHQQIVTEETKWKMGPEVSGYSISKYSAEKEVWRGIEEGLKAVIINPCVIFGAGSWSESSLSIFKQVTSGARFYPPGSNATVDARDVAMIMVQLMNSEIHSERFLCIGSNQSFKELMTEIATQSGKALPKYQASKWLVQFIRIIGGFFAFILRKKPIISKETMNSLFSNRSYSNEKVIAATGIQFRGLTEQVRNALAGRLDQS